MRPRHEKEMITAYVDGELTPAEREQVQEMLRQSAPARALLRRLQEDARNLRDLPRSRLAPDFSQSVLQSIRQRGMRRSYDRPSGLSPVPLWTTVAAAASVILVIGLGTFLYMARGGDTDPSSPDPQASVKPTLQEPPVDPKKNKPEEGVIVHKDEPPDKPIPPLPPEGPGRTEIVKEPMGELDPLDPDPMRETGPVFGAPGEDRVHAHIADVVVPTLYKVHQLHKEQLQEDLGKQFGKTEGAYVEILARDANVAYARLAQAARQQGIALHIDGLAQARLKLKNQANELAVMLENITPEELVALLSGMSKNDVEAEKRKSRSSVFFDTDPNLIVTRLIEDHRRRLRALTGSEMNPISPAEKPSAQARPEPDLTKPLSEQTLAAVEAALDKGAQPSEKPQGLVLYYNLRISRATSAEVRDFLRRRQPQREGAMQALLVLRTK